MIRRLSTRLETAQPEASQYGILSPAVTVVHETTDDWIAEFSYSTADDSVDVINHSIFGVKDGPVSDRVAEPVEGAATFRPYYPFDIRASVKSSTFGTTLDDIQKSAENALEVVTQKAVEREFWTGTIAKGLVDSSGNRYLASDEAVDVTPTAGTGVKVRYGQALLEQAIGDATIGAEGVIHAPRLVASVMKTDTDSGALVTKLGNKIVAGTGYALTGPDGTVAPAGSAWMYATGPVTVHLGKMPVVTPEQVSQAVDTATNTVVFYVDRPAAVTWSTSYLYAVLVDLSKDYN